MMQGDRAPSPVRPLALHLRGADKLARASFRVQRALAVPLPAVLSSNEPSMSTTSVSPELFRRVVGNFPTGITVLTVEREPGQVHGMTANSFTSVSLDPLLILVCIDQNARLLSFLKRQGRFGVNILEDSQRHSPNILPSHSRIRKKNPPGHSFPMDSDRHSTSQRRPRASCVQRRGAAHLWRPHHLCCGSRKPGLKEGEPLLYHRGQYRRLHP